MYSLEARAHLPMRQRQSLKPLLKFIMILTIQAFGSYYEVWHGPAYSKKVNGKIKALETFQITG
jgi:hypothetical protein